MEIKAGTRVIAALTVIVACALTMAGRADAQAWLFCESPWPDACVWDCIDEYNGCLQNANDVYLECVGECPQQEYETCAAECENEVFQPLFFDCEDEVCSCVYFCTL